MVSQTKLSFWSLALLGRNNGGGDDFFSKVKRLVQKCIGTRKRLFSGFIVSHVGF